MEVKTSALVTKANLSTNKPEKRTSSELNPDWLPSLI